MAKSETNNQVASQSSVEHDFPVVCLGGSAGAFQPLETFFAHLPSDTGMAYIIILHLSKHKPSMLSNVIERYTSLPVHTIEDKMKVEPDHVYVIPPGKDIYLKNRRFLLRELKQKRGVQMPIDHFLESMAEDIGAMAAAIILSGMDSDGETGIRMIKEGLGLVIAQSPETAEFYDMPSSSIQTGKVDYVLSPEEMPEYLLRYMHHPAIRMNGNPEDAISQTRVENSLQRIFVLLRAKSGHDFSQYKKNTIIRRIERRIASNQLKGIVEYVQFLREKPVEIENLFKELLIGVTKFFRDEEAFEKLQEQLEKVIKQKDDEDTLRIWSAGCSTGEEAYTLAILVCELLEKLDRSHTLRVQIFATDLDPEAVEKSRNGTYFPNIVANVSKERIKKYFSKGADGMYHVRKELREMIIFAQHNIIKDAPFTRLDLLCCRNLLIYLSHELQKKLIPLFYYALDPAGLMFLGPSESISSFMELFSVRDSKWKIFGRRNADAAMNKMIDFNFVMNRYNELAGHQKTKEILPQKLNLIEDAFNRILLAKHAPTAFLVNEKGDIIFIHGDTSKLLEITSGHAMMNINKLAREELRYEISQGIQKATAKNERAITNSVKLKEDDYKQLVNVTVHKIHEAEILQGLFMIVIEKAGIELKKSAKTADKSNLNAAEVNELEKELLQTRQQLQNTIEQMESSVEELKSTNEELQSTNEELQSTNEEAITTKEEMQSLNEELLTINAQYESRTEELIQTNNDMKNLLESTHIATIFLDSELNLLRFTPQIKKIVRLISGDIGRPILHMSINLKYSQLEEDIRYVQNTLNTKETEVETEEGAWYNMRINPYRTVDNFIHGTVITFSDISKQKELEHHLNIALKLAEATVNTVPDPMIVLTSDLKIINANRAFCRQFGLEQEYIKNQPLVKLNGRQFSSADLMSKLQQLIESDTEFTDFTLEINLLDGKSYSCVIKGNRILGYSDKDTLILLTLNLLKPAS